jgi:hypothetical protein
VLPTPWGATGTELHHALINVHRSIRNLAVRNVYDDAIAQVFDTFAFSNVADVTFYLLQLIGYAKPLNAKQLVRRVLFSEHLSGMRLNTYDLHTLALSVASKYLVDDELLSYIDRSARRSSDLRYLLVCFRARSVNPSERPTEMIQHFIAIAAGDTEVKEIVRELRGFTAVAGYEALLRWYINSIELMVDEGSPNLPTFEQYLLHDLTGTAIESPKLGDPYRAGLAAAVLARQRPIEPHEYAALAQMRDWDEEDVRRVLEFLWTQQRRYGWKVYVSSPDEFDRVAPTSRDTISIFNDRGEASINIRLWPAAAATLQQLDALASGRIIVAASQRSFDAS